jgi:hypothetical protein
MRRRSARDRGGATVVPSSVRGAPELSCCCSLALPLHKRRQVGGNQVEISGFHAKRREFEPEYDNDAEMIVADLEFRDGEPPEDTAAKLHIVDVYNARLDERERRRDFILERGLLNIRRQQVSGAAAHAGAQVLAAERRGWGWASPLCWRGL